MEIVALYFTRPSSVPRFMDILGPLDCWTVHGQFGVLGRGCGPCSPTLQSPNYAPAHQDEGQGLMGLPPFPDHPTSVFSWVGEWTGAVRSNVVVKGTGKNILGAAHF